MSLALGDEEVCVLVDVSSYAGRLRHETTLTVSGVDETKAFGVHGKVRAMIRRRFQEVPRFRRSAGGSPSPLVALLIAPLAVAIGGGVVVGVVLWLLHIA